MKKWICFGWLLLMLACTDGSQYDTALEGVRAVLYDNPSMALEKLDSLKTYWNEFPNDTRMRWQLLQLSAQNKCDTIFRSDSLQRELVAYFDRHGTPNERMHANYLLGRAYSDMGEAPLALKWFQKAAESADTTAVDCDFHTLFVVYGQIALTFDRQNLYREEIEALKKFSHFALKDSDTYYYIRGIEFQENPYYCLDDTLNMMRTMEKARQLYLENGWKESAAAVYPPAILLLLQDGQYQRAYAMMQIFEGESGLFDADGNIAPGREHYYNSRGLYHLGVHQVDSAEYYFRKLLKFNVNRNYDVYDGLHAVYRARRDIDSVMKYAALSEQALDSIQKDDQSEAVAIAHSMYNYNRMERMVEQKEIEAVRMRWRIILAVVMGLVALLFVIQRYRRYKKKKERELEEISKEFFEKKEHLEQAKRNLALLEEDKNRLAEEMHDEIVQLQEEVHHYKQKYECDSIYKRELLLENSPIVKKLHKKGMGNPKENLPTDDEWMQLAEAIHEQLPEFYASILQDDLLTYEEKRLCMLCRLNFYNGEIALLFDKSPQSITNMKSAVNYKLFGSKSASSLNDNLKK